MEIIAAIVLRLVAHVHVGSAIPGRAGAAVVEVEAAVRLEHRPVSALAVPFLHIVAVDRLEEPVAPTAGAVEVIPDKEIIRGRGRLRLTAVSADEEVGGPLIGIGPAAGEVDGGAPAVEDLVLLKADPVVVAAGATPGASAIAHADIVHGLVVVEDEGSIEEVVGMKHAARELARFHII